MADSLVIVEAVVEQHEPMIANADLWAKYFEEQWRPWLAPLGLQAPVPQMAEGTAARIAAFLALVVGGPIAWLYASNLAQHAEPERALAIEAEDAAA